MRRTTAALVATFSSGLLAAGLLAAPGASADRAGRPAGPASDRAVERAAAAHEAATPAAQASPRAVLATARRLRNGEQQAADPSYSVALRDLWLARPDLVGTEHYEADALLARPTDGAADPFQNGYSVPSTKACSADICVHYVTSTADAPPSAEWVSLTLKTMQDTWAAEVRGLGYRAPERDGGRGGDGKFDVYLKDLGTGLYGYCAPERRKKARTASGFCVLDNDYSPAQFPSGSPQGNLEVTAAHEFFHAVQYAYDYAEDSWMMESTATWMEERVADDVDDNRQYLPYSQLYAPMIPLDAFSTTYGFQYGNWIFWEYLSHRYGKGLVKDVWRRAGSLKKDGRLYSVQALRAVLRRKGGLSKVYTQFAAGNMVPSATYPEGASYQAPHPKATVRLRKGSRSSRKSLRLDHLAARAYRFRPDGGLSGKRWRLRVRVEGPEARTAPMAHVTVHKANGRLQHRFVRLDRRGDGAVLVPFDSRRVAGVTVTLANTSTRYRCGRDTVLACEGRPLDDNARFVVKAQVLKKRG